MDRERVAFVDQLTNLPDRRQLSTILARTADFGDADMMVGLCLIDLDENFKAINNTLGHAVGDTVLADVARRLRRAALNAGFELFRIRGDEFAALQISEGDIRTNLEALAIVFATAMAAPFEVGNGSRSIGVSIGVAVTSAATATADELLEAAYLERHERPAPHRRRSGRDSTLDSSLAGEQPQLPSLYSLTHPWPDRAVLDRVQHWVGRYLAQPHPDLGRAGPICPFVPASIKHNLISADWVAGSTPDIDGVCARLRGLIPLFLTAPPTEGPTALLKTQLILFPDVRDYALIDAVQRRLKPEFVDAGLMIGQFYPGCAEPGLWNPDFRPLDAPIALIAIRNMVANDFPFLADNPDWITGYLRRFAPKVPAAIRDTLADRLVQP